MGLGDHARAEVLPGHAMGCVSIGDPMSGRCCSLGWGDQGAQPYPSIPFVLQEKLKPGYLEQLPGKLKLFSNFLGDRKWFAGEKVLLASWRGQQGLGRVFVSTLILTMSPSLSPAHLRGLPHV